MGVSFMNQNTIFQPNMEMAKSAHIDAKTYEKIYAASIDNPDQFWAEQGQRIDWMKPYSMISDVSYDAADLHIRWYADGTLNAAVCHSIFFILSPISNQGIQINKD